MRASAIKGMIKGNVFDRKTEMAPVETDKNEEENAQKILSFQREQILTLCIIFDIIFGNRALYPFPQALSKE